MKKLSIITINLNNTAGLHKTIESVVNQTSRNFEYIIIDGGSTDGSVDVIKAFADNISYWVSEPDNGIYQAMNKGIRVAKGEYCQFLNSGDWLVEFDVIEKMLAALPDCSVFYGNMLKLLPKGKYYRDRCESGNISLFTFLIGSLNHSPNFIKRNLFEKYGYYDESLRIVSDWKFYLQVVGLNNEPIRYIDIDVAWFNMNGISNTNKSLHQMERELVLKALLPKAILTDYKKFIYYGPIYDRLKKNKVLWSIIWNIYRILLKYDKIIKRKDYENIS